MLPRSPAGPAWSAAPTPRAGSPDVRRDRRRGTDPPGGRPGAGRDGAGLPRGRHAAPGSPRRLRRRCACSAGVGVRPGDRELRHRGAWPRGGATARRRDLPCGHAGPAHLAGHPLAAGRARRDDPGRGGGPRPDRGPADVRRRRLQAHQRHAGAPRRRPGAGGVRPTAPPWGPGGGPRRAPGRRRVRRAHRPGHEPRRRGEPGGPAAAGAGAPIVLDDIELSVRCSVGLAVYGDDGTSVDELLRTADLAMYSAKGLGTGRWQRYNPASQVPTAARSTRTCATASSTSSWSCTTSRRWTSGPVR